MISKRRSRYMLIEASAPIDIKEARSAMAFSKAIERQSGELGLLEIDPKPVFQYAPNVFAIRINRGSEKKAALALSFAKDINGIRMGFYTIRTSGTIRALTASYRGIYAKSTGKTAPQPA